ncbi:MAG: SRPBCC family protein [Herbiconiux sp.]|uniref:SRPBCC family protein n=1 Tax=Herbiconiux sp. TaxID=1871186 RepID=UPI001218EC7F|nr:SRPBCC family protein [Herbiconiux sp.]TAJ47642.1 MAG: SRPBCC family protein [Herbiconiux sp.]
MTGEARHIGITIDRSPAGVAAFAGDPANLGRWAAGLGDGLRHEDGRWLTDMPDGTGTVEVRFVGPVEAGVLDHEVHLPDGTVVVNPLRVLPNDAGSEVVFTVFRRDGVDHDAFEADAAAVAADLATLKRLLEA